MPTFRQGDVVKVPFPHMDQSTRQRRPTLVVSARLLGRDETVLWVAMITSADNAPWADDVELTSTPGRTGLTAASVVRPCKLATIEAAHCEKLGNVDDAVMEQVLETIGRFLK